MLHTLLRRRLHVRSRNVPGSHFDHDIRSSISHSSKLSCLSRTFLRSACTRPWYLPRRFSSCRHKTRCASSCCRQPSLSSCCLRSSSLSSWVLRLSAALLRSHENNCWRSIDMAPGSTVRHRLCCNSISPCNRSHSTCAASNRRRKRASSRSPACSRQWLLFNNLASNGHHFRQRDAGAGRLAARLPQPIEQGLPLLQQ